MSTAAARSTRPRRVVLLALAVTTGLATALSGALVGAEASAATTYASTAAPSGVLPAANTCGTYSYRYVVDPPSDNWMLNTTVVDPRGNAVSSYSALGNGYSRTDATTSFVLCRNNTMPGVFTIKADFSVSDENNQDVTHYPVSPSTFTLSEPTASVATQQTVSKKKSTKNKKKSKNSKKNRKKKNRHRR